MHCWLQCNLHKSQFLFMFYHFCIGQICTSHAEKFLGIIVENFDLCVENFSFLRSTFFWPHHVYCLFCGVSVVCCSINQTSTSTEFITRLYRRFLWPRCSLWKTKITRVSNLTNTSVKLFIWCRTANVNCCQTFHTHSQTGCRGRAQVHHTISRRKNEKIFCGGCFTTSPDCTL